MISFAEAARIVGSMAQPVGAERIPLEDAAGRVLAEPVIARVDAPPADCSSMDGYAVREAELPGSLRIAGRSVAGLGYDGPLEPGHSVRIFTGAPVPHGADRIVIQEDVVADGNMVTVPAAQGPRFIRARGSDFCAGDILLEAGQVLTPRALVAAAASDHGEVSVWRRPKVVVLATGDELASPGSASERTGAIPDSVSIGVMALANDWGGQALSTVRLADDLPTLDRAAGDALRQADLVIVTGGASVGERDFAKPMFERHGLELFFSKVAIKPGKPVWFGRAGSSFVLGLPGNPTSALVTARLFLAPILAGLTGRSDGLAFFEVPLAAPLPPCGDRETFVRARRTSAGALPVANQDSGAQRALAESDLLLRSPAHSAGRSAGESVQAIAF